MNPKKQNLLEFKHDLETRYCSQIHLIWLNGEKSGIGNKEAITKVINLLKEEIQRQIDEL